MPRFLRHTDSLSLSEHLGIQDMSLSVTTKQHELINRTDCKVVAEVSHGAEDS